MVHLLAPAGPLGFGPCSFYELVISWQELHQELGTQARIYVAFTGQETEKEIGSLVPAPRGCGEHLVVIPTDTA